MELPPDNLNLANVAGASIARFLIVESELTCLELPQSLSATIVNKVMPQVPAPLDLYAAKDVLVNIVNIPPFLKGKSQFDSSRSCKRSED